jgi:hypothetical protein
MAHGVTYKDFKEIKWNLMVSLHILSQWIIKLCLSFFEKKLKIITISEMTKQLFILALTSFQ